MLRAVPVVAQGTKQGCAFFQTQGFSPGSGFHASLRQRGAETALRIGGLEIIPQSFALVAKGEFEEVDESVIHLSIRDKSITVESQFLLSWRHSEAKCGGMHFRWWRKGTGRQGE